MLTSMLKQEYVSEQSSWTMYVTHNVQTKLPLMSEFQSNPTYVWTQVIGKAENNYGHNWNTNLEYHYTPATNKEFKHKNELKSQSLPDTENRKGTPEATYGRASS